MKKSAKKRKMKLYEENAYLNEFETKITNIDHENNYIELEKTAFYGQSGGQPGDTGILEINSKKIEVKNTLKNKFDEGNVPESISKEWERITVKPT